MHPENLSENHLCGCQIFWRFDFLKPNPNRFAVFYTPIICDGKWTVQLLVVLTEVISELYKNLSLTSESSTKLCLMFIDAAHQYEALLDVLLILGHIDITLLKSGCDELISMLHWSVRTLCFIWHDLSLSLGWWSYLSQLSWEHTSLTRLGKQYIGPVGHEAGNFFLKTGRQADVVFMLFAVNWATGKFGNHFCLCSQQR